MSRKGEEHGTDAALLTKVDDVAVGVVVDVFLGVIWSLGVEGSELIVLLSFITRLSRDMKNSLYHSVSLFEI